MADRVEEELEKMIGELKHYQKEELFTRKEIKKIVKLRRQHEYDIVRKDADVRHYMEAVEFEKKLDSIKEKRKVKQRKFK
jgi:uncharacterized protein (UPF0335 family)